MDIVDRTTRSRMMSGIRGKNTKPELIVRKQLYSCGLRFRLHSKNLPGKPDLVFSQYKTVLFVHGCFWHHHRNCKYAYMPKSNRRFWRSKILGNAKRDGKHYHALKRLGWRPLVLWECQLGEARIKKIASMILCNP